MKALSREMSKILITRKIPKSLSWEKEDVMPRNEIISILKDNTDVEALLVLLTDKIDGEVLSLVPNCKVVSTLSVGYNHIDVEECKRRKIRIGYTPNVLTNATAELAVSLLCAVARKVVQGEKAVRSGEWKPEWLLGKEICGSTVGVVGMGRIGAQFAKIMKFGFGCNLLYSGPSQKDIDWANYVEFDELLQNSDFVVPHCNLNEKTRGMFNKTAFKKMKKDSIFINTTRGDVVNQDDLYNALKDGDILAAGIDVTTPEPLPVDDKLLSLVLPHIGSATTKTREEMSMVAAKNLLAGLKGEKMVYEIL